MFYICIVSSKLDLFQARHTHVKKIVRMSFEGLWISTLDVQETDLAKPYFSTLLQAFRRLGF
jgi:hypothetical protein